MGESEIKLRYVGRGSWLPDVPARDLTEADIAGRKLNVKALLKSGLYEEVPRKRGRLEE